MRTNAWRLSMIASVARRRDDVTPEVGVGLETYPDEDGKPAGRARADSLSRVLPFGRNAW